MNTIKIKRIMVKSVCISTILLSLPALAVQWEGTKIVTIPASKPPVATPGGQFKPSSLNVGLMKVKLSKDEITVLKDKAKLPLTPLLRAGRNNLSIGSQAELDMKSFPVLNQGEHGSCVTFASTAALNYVLGKPDYVSQLCSLAIGSTLSDTSYYPSGWDGSSIPIVLEKLARFGYVTKADQERYGCAGFKKYPLRATKEWSGNDVMKNSKMSLADYYRMSYAFEVESTNYFSQLYFKPIVTELQYFGRDKLEPHDPDRAVEKVKQVLAMKQDENSKAAVAVGAFLYSNECSVGACAKAVVANDTWAATEAIKEKMSKGVDPDAGHAMLIIGYDDAATAVDQNGQTHTGLFKLRNSWGPGVGDRGNYYMTYDYFKLLAVQVYQIGHVYKNENNH